LAISLLLVCPLVALLLLVVVAIGKDFHDPVPGVISIDGELVIDDIDQALSK
jgi:hypothetical protein